MGTVGGWGPLVALVLIGGIATATAYVHRMALPSTTGDLLLLAWLAIVLAILLSFFASIYVGPGYVKQKWVPCRLRKTEAEPEMVERAREMVEREREMVERERDG